jgi:hypothetical protein
MSTQLANYDHAKAALAVCVRVDEAARIKDRAARLEAYARIRDDEQMLIDAAELQRRACIKIGELSRELDKAQGARTDTSSERSDKVKSKALKAAGISRSTAHDYEQLAGGSEKNGQAAAAAAAEQFFAKARAEQRPADMKGLKAAVREAVDRAVPRERSASKPKRDPHYDAWLHWVSAIRDVADLNEATFPQMMAVATRLEVARDNINEAKRALRRLGKWLATLEADDG